MFKKFKFYLKKIEEKDSPLMKKMAQKCGSLDVHTSYTYWVVSHFFSDLCFFLCKDDQEIGYIMSIETESTIFIWQIGILEDYRGMGLSELLISEVYNISKSKEKNLSFSIAKENIRSNKAFQSFCNKRNLTIKICGEIRLPDLYDVSFSERETLYEVEFSVEAQS